MLIFVIQVVVNKLTFQLIMAGKKVVIVIMDLHNLTKVVILNNVVKDHTIHDVVISCDVYFIAVLVLLDVQIT